MPQPKPGVLALLSSQALLPICSHSQLCTEELWGDKTRRDWGEQQEAQARGCVGLWENEAQSKVSNGERK